VWHVRLHLGVVVAGCASGHVLLLPIDGDRPRRSLQDGAAATAHAGSVTCMAADARHHVVYTGGADRTVKVRGSGALCWPASLHAQCSHATTRPAHGPAPRQAWSLPAGTLLFTLAEHRAALTALYVHSDLGVLVTGTADGTVRVFPTAPADASAAPLCRWTLHGHVHAISAIIVAAPDRARERGKTDDALADAATAPTDDPAAGHARRRWPLAAATAVGGTAAGAAAAAGALRLLTASQDGQIRAWDVSEHASGACLATLAYHTRAVTTLAYDPASNTLASAALDERVALWDLSTYGRVYRRYTPGASTLALRDSVLVVGRMGAVAPSGGPGAVGGGGSSWDAGSAGGAGGWADAATGLSLVDVRTRTVLRRLVPLQGAGRGGAETLQHLAFSDNCLVVGMGDAMTLLRLSRSRAVRRSARPGIV